jgi:hypothetical protein
MLEKDEANRLSNIALALVVNAQEILINSKIFDLLNGIFDK